MNYRTYFAYFVAVLLLTNCSSLNPFSSDTPKEPEEKAQQYDPDNPPRYTWEINESLKNTLKKRILV
ncbi:MAG: hypothetical protein ACKOA8_19670, partial [Deltaproteobacteria bacterium]